jgi:hypothetical protein
MFRLFFGLGLGYLLGTLYAPRKGSEVREDLRKKLLEVRDDVAQRGLGAKEEFSEGLSRASESLAKADELAAGAVDKLGKGIHDIATKRKNSSDSD